MKRCFFWLLVGCSALAAGCATVQQFIKQPSVTVADVALKDMGLFEETLLFTLNVDNPNPIGGRIRTLAYRLNVNGREMLSSTMDKGITLKPNGTEPVELPVTLKLLDLFQSGREFLTAESAEYDLAGSMAVGPFQLPFKKTGTLTLPKLPQLSLADVRVENLSLRGADLQLNMNVANDNPFAVQLQGLDYACRLGDVDLATGNVKSLPAVDQGGTTALSVPVQLDFMQLGRAAYQLLTGTSADYELSGDMLFAAPGGAEKRFPFKKTGRVPFKQKQP